MAWSDVPCKIWTGAVTSKGYGLKWDPETQKLQLVHRLAFRERHGRFPAPGMVTDHMCEVKLCHEAEHLQELTNAENIRLGWSRRGVCKKGHKLAEGASKCGVCKENTRQRRRAREGRP